MDQNGGSVLFANCPTEARVRDTIRFLFGDEERQIRGLSPTTTVLEWLRTTARAIGTKEGCAEGDCGACTVVLGAPDAGGMAYRAVNACILFIAALDGRQLLTVEHLRAPDGSLHPVQQAIVDQHASQCGFCTPGIVMSLFALYHAGASPLRGEVNEALAGNLCRCTGYRPIIAAARQACAGAPRDRFSAAAAATATRLSALGGEEPLAVQHDGERFLVPRSIEQLAGLLRHFPEATLLAGGTDVGLWVSKQHRALPTVIALEGVRELARIDQTDAAIRIGAGAAYEDALGVLERHWPDFGALIRRIGSRQIRNRGSIGGNIANASPIGDALPPLIALEATLLLRNGPDQRTLPVESFFPGYRRTALGRGEFIARIDLPRPLPGQEFRAYKVSKRFEQDISAVCAAFRLTREDGAVRDIRIAYGGVAATPVRARRTEQVLLGRPWTRASVEAGMRALDGELAPISDQRASAAYRQALARNLLLKFLLETTPECGGRTRLLEEAAA
jgi:xanthine dehydrogenase small subunit